jgi:excisionase family DNA binding protein
MTAPTAEKPGVAQLHSVPVARRRLNVGLTKFYELINSGELRTVKIGARRLVSEEAIVEFIARLEAEAGLQAQYGNALIQEAA